MEEPSIIKQRISLWQILFYLSMSVVLAWLILKLTGIIQTPIWLEFGVPIAGLFFGVFTMYHNLMKAMNKVGIGLATLTLEVKHMGEDVRSLNDDMKTVKKKLHLH